MLKSKKLSLSLHQVLTVSILSINYKKFLDANCGENENLEPNKNQVENLPT